MQCGTNEMRSKPISITLEQGGSNSKQTVSGKKVKEQNDVRFAVRPH